MRLFLLFILSSISCSVFGQSPYIATETLSENIYQRWLIKYSDEIEDPYFSAFRNQGRASLMSVAGAVARSSGFSEKDAADLKYIIQDNSEYYDAFYSSYSGSPDGEGGIKKVFDEQGLFYYTKGDGEDFEYIKYKERKPLLTHFYKSDAHFFEINNKDFKLRINPILHLTFGDDLETENLYFRNTRGVEIRGLIDDNVYFYTNIVESQARFLNYLEERIERFKSIPGQGLYKTFNSTVIESLTGYDFLNAQAYVGVNISKSVALELGHGRHFIGDGIRSLVLSEYANNYFYLKFNTKIWKFRYQNLFAELSPISANTPGIPDLLPKKYFAMHTLTFKPWKTAEFGLFETVVFSRQNQFELQYLNPIILYRTVEQFIGSPDNALLGVMGRQNFLKRYQAYGQFILDEFKFSEITSGNGWWANKFGLQLGLKAIDFLNVDHLDVQVEYNVARPYMYSHNRPLDAVDVYSTASYSHYSQPLAHPLGSNFREYILDIRYRPTSKWQLHSRLVTATSARDGELGNLGNNILLNNSSRVSDFGNSIGQGNKVNTTLLRLDASYQFFHNYFIDLNYLYRTADSDVEEFSINTHYFGAGIRVNINSPNIDF